MNNKNIRNTKKKASKNNYFAVLSTVAVMSTMLASMPTEVMASNPTQTVTFANNLQQAQSKTINIPDLVRVENISTDNGNVTYSISGDNLSINVAGGTATGQQYNATKFSKSATKSTTSSTDSFASTTSYSDGDGYAGTLSKSGSSYLVSGSYTASASKTATDSQTNTSNSFPATVSYNSGGYSGTLSKSGSVTSSTQATGTRYVSDGYYENTGYYESTGYYEETGYWKTTPGHYERSDCTTWVIDGKTGGTCFEEVWVPGTSTWVSTGTKWVSTGSTWVSTGRQWVDTSYYETTYTTYYTQNYSGTVTKPAVDTRVFGQNYAGTAYKAGYDNLYAYNVTVEVVTDIIPPAPATFSPNTTSPTNQNVTLGINYANDAVVKQYKIGEAGTWTVYTAPLTLSANTIVYARSADEAGNMSEANSFSVKNIDKVAPITPTLASDKTAPVNTDVKVSASFPTDSVKNEVRKDNGSWTTYSTAVNFTANGKLEARSTDNAGNVSAVGTYNVSNIDKIAPTEPTVTSVENQNTINVSAIADEYSGVKETRYRLNGGEWTVYSSTLSLPDGQYTVDVVVEDKAGNVSPVKTSSFDLYENRLGEASESVPQAENTRLQDDVDSAFALVNKMPASPEKTALTNRLNEVQRQIDTKEAIDQAVSSDTLVDFNKAQVKSDTVTNETVKAILQSELDTQKAYLNRLVEAEKLVTTAETVKTQASVDSARDYVNTIELDEQAPLDARLDDVQDVINAKTAIELASKTRNPVDVQDAKDKIELLDQTNPVVVVIMDEMTNDFETADILSLVSKERYDILLTRYEMSKVAYNSLVQSYYAIKYTGDSMYKLADEKFKLVPSTDKYFDLVQSQYDNLNIDYTEFVEERTASDAELRANSSVSSLEKSYSVSLATSTQALILLVEDATVKQELQSRYNQAKAKYELSLSDKAVESATSAVENAEKYKYVTYVNMAQERVTALPDGDVKLALQVRLDALKGPVVDQDKAVAKAKADIGLATKYRYEYYVKRAQASIDLVTDDAVRAELQAQLDALK